MREREYALPKPDGLLRVVLLGDSLVWGLGCAAEDRMGAQLERLLGERAQAGAPKVEVLHVAIGGWNLEAECAYLRRQLSAMKPDLVLQVTTLNDLDDLQGVRGFGEKARYSPQRRERADARIETPFPGLTLHLAETSPLPWGIDHESLTRFAEARTVLEDLARRVEALGVRFGLLLHWGPCTGAAGRHLIGGLRADQVLALPESFWDREELLIEPDNQHWNARGMELVAELLYGWIRARGLLPALELAPSAAADEMLALAEGDGRAELVRGPGNRWEEFNTLDAEVDASRLAQEQGSHFHGGIDLAGRLGPYASIALRNRGAARLELRGSGLDRPEIDGLRLAVYADEFLLEELVLHPGERIERSWPLPAACAERAIVDARFEASDFVFVGADLQHCVSFRLERVALAGP
jgi:lysophospholipase L1-like esterase